MRRALSQVSLRWLAALALGCFVLHAGNHALHGHPAQALWACTIATLVLAVGLWRASARLCAVAVCWLCLGNPSWVFDLLSGHAFMATSLLTHVGGMILGCLAVWRLGYPAGTWWRAALAGAALQLACRLGTARSENVNLAWDMYPGFEKYYPSYAWYWGSLMLLQLAVFLPSELVFRLLLRGPSPRSR